MLNEEYSDRRAAEERPVARALPLRFPCGPSCYQTSAADDFNKRRLWLISEDVHDSG
jgi:hypothetical protein